MRIILMLLLLLTVGLLGLTSIPAHAEKGVVMIITGTVEDSVTNTAIAGAIVSSNADVSPVQSGRDGSFKFILLSAKPVMLRVIKEGYKPFEKLINLQDRINLAVRLERKEQEITIAFSDFRRNSFIKGRVDGLAPEEYDRFKILVYVLTDKWYIHPWAENAPERGYAVINDDGTWKIRTVWRGYQAYRVAFLLTEKDTYAPSTVSAISDNPDQDLLARIPYRARLIVEAPEGI